MKKILLYLLLAAMFASCTKEQFDAVGPQTDAATEGDVSYKPTTRGAPSTALWHEGAGAWIVSQPDPYTLENFKAAYKELLSGTSNQSLTKKQTADLAAMKELKPTHYALRIYPKDEEEQWKYEMMDGIHISYTPFDHVQLTQEETKTLPTDKMRKGGAVFPESYRHKVTYYNVETTEGIIPEQTFILPILYAVWPIDKPLPDIEYEIAYKVFLPLDALAKSEKLRDGKLDLDILTAIESVAVSRALGIPEKPQTRAFVTPNDPVLVNTNPKAYIQHWDNVMNDYVPVENILVKFTLGSFSYAECYTQQDGSVSLLYTRPVGQSTVTSPILGIAFVTLYFQHSKWKIVEGDSTAAYSEPICTVEDLLSQPYYMKYSYDFAAPIFECARAANHYFIHNSSILKSHSRGPITIHAYTETTTPEGSRGVFRQRYPYLPNIGIGNLDRLKHGVLLGTILHELGHYTMWEFFWESVPYSGNHQILLAEIWASYVGWLLTEEYYGTLGWVKPCADYQLTLQGRQDWYKNKSGNLKCYAPLYVDLVDDYNQKKSDSSPYPDDNIKDFPIEEIRLIAASCKTWSSLKTRLQQYIGVYYTETDFNNYIESYDYWFSNN